MRIYVAAARADVEALAAGGAVTAEAFIPESEDEEAEFAAFGEAADHGAVVISADVAAADEPVTLDKVAAFHVDVDGSGDLAWFATQEIDAVLLAMGSTASED
ncbi:MAG: hypothetical protein M3Q98_15065 [Actinomycetota bacterium]|nr:hypothetical protein [Actinomycetota bacterium]